MPAYKKALPVVAGIIFFAYVVFPFDILPDPFPIIGQLDDSTLFLLLVVPAVWLFIRLCPKEVVKEHSQQISRN